MSDLPIGVWVRESVTGTLRMAPKKNHKSTSDRSSGIPLRARWIWTSEELPPSNQFVFFRKCFEIPVRPSNATCRITAERFYQFWVNGDWVGQGPAMGLPEEKSFDLYSVSDFLRPGTNAIGVLVNFDRKKGAGGLHFDWFVPETCAGLWCQLEGEVQGRPFLVHSDNTWTTRRAAGWKAEVPFMNDMYYQEHYCFGKDPVDWSLPAFNDAAWSRATELGNSAGERDDGSRLPWHQLIERDTPSLRRHERLPSQVQTGEVVEHFTSSDVGLRMSLEPVGPLTKARIERPEALLEADAETCAMYNSDPQESEYTWDGNHDATLIVDFDELLNAHLIIEVEGPAEACLHIGYAPDLVDGRACPYRSERTSWADSVTLDANGRYRWRSYHWRQFRYVQITLRNSPGPVRIRHLFAEKVGQEWESTTELLCSDSQLQTFWKAAERTAETCTVDTFMDNASRETRQYTGDIGFMVPGIAALHGNPPITRRYLNTLTRAQQANGLFLDCCPGKGRDASGAFSACFTHVEQIWNNYVWFGDRNQLEERWGAIQRHLGLWTSLANDRGMLVVEEAGQGIGLRPFRFFPYFDWAHMDRRGEMLLLNAMYALNLNIGSQIAHLLCEKQKQEEYGRLADQIGDTLRSEFWSEDAGLFVDALIDHKQSREASEHGQGTMLFLGLASKKQASQIVDGWQAMPDRLSKASINFLYRVVEGLIRYGFGDFALDLFRRCLKHHLHTDNVTFGEIWALRGSRVTGRWATGDSRATSQGSGSWPAMFLLENLVGIQPRFGTMGGIRLAPHIWSQSAEAEWFGNKVEWGLSNRTWHLMARFQRPTLVECVLPFAEQEVQSVLLNGKKALIEPVYNLKDCEKLEVVLDLFSA